MIAMMATFASLSLLNPSVYASLDLSPAQTLSLCVCVCVSSFLSFSVSLDLSVCLSIDLQA